MRVHTRHLIPAMLALGIAMGCGDDTFVDPVPNAIDDEVSHRTHNVTPKP